MCFSKSPRTVSKNWDLEDMIKKMSVGGGAGAQKKTSQKKDAPRETQNSNQKSKG
jgi:hypothetical protein